jgi:hypothetical protein
MVYAVELNPIVQLRNTYCIAAGNLGKEMCVSREVWGEETAIAGVWWSPFTLSLQTVFACGVIVR